MQHFRAFVISAAFLVISGVQAAETGDAPQPYFVMQLQDCSLPVCEEQEVYLTADGWQMFLDDPRARVPKARLDGMDEKWHRARPEAFAEVSQLARILARELPADAECERPAARRLSVHGTLVLWRETVTFHYTDDCAGQTSHGRHSRLIRQLREAFVLGVQPLLRG